MEKVKRNSSWKVLEKRDIFKAEPRLTVSVQRVKLPNGGIVDDYYQICLPEAVVMMARTIEGKIVMCRQYRHALGRVSLIFPAGTIEKGESPIETAKRELLEETGYSSQEWRLLGSYVLHGNYGCGKVHFFFASNTKQSRKPASGDLEDMEILLMDESEITNAIRSGDVISLGTIAGLSLVKTLL